MLKIGRSRESLQDKIFRVRYTAYNGAVIALHHSMKREKFTVSLLLSIITIPLIFNFLIIYFSGDITAMWSAIFNFWINKFDLAGTINGDTVGAISVSFFNKVVHVPYPQLQGTVPSGFMWWATFLASAVVFVISFFFSWSYLPLAYFLRLVTFINMLTNVYFLMHPDFQYDLTSLISGNLLLSYKLILLAPWILAFTYNIFNFSYFKKFMLAAIVVVYMSIFIPFQYIFHAIVVHQYSMVFLPALHLLFGSFMDIIVFMSIYAWGLSWRKKKPNTNPIKKK